MITVRGEGCTVWDDAGNSYLDGMAGLWCVNVGYGREEIVEAAAAQMRVLPYTPLTRPSPVALELATELAAMLPGTLNHVFLSNSGSEAVETAIKMARQSQRQRFPGESRYKIISRYRGYHGWSMGAIGATGQVSRKQKFEPVTPGIIHARPPSCYRCPFGQTYGSCHIECVEDIASMIEYEGAETIAAVIAEPIISGGGMIPAPPEYFPRLREICDRNGILIIADEVISGFGRTGKMFGCEHWGGALPDIMAMAKGLTSAYVPMGATAASDAVWSTFYGEPGTEFAQLSTFGGHPVASAVARANLAIIKREDLAGNAARVGTHLLESLHRLRHRAIGDIRGRGLMLGVELVGENKEPLPQAKVDAVLGAVKQRGVLLARNSYSVPRLSNVITISPPLVITTVDADRIVSALGEALDAVIPQHEVSLA